MNITRLGGPIMYSKILVPLDGSDNAYRALDHAIDLAKVFHSELYLLHIIDTGRANSYSGGMAAGLVYKELLENDEQRGQAILDKAVAIAEKEDVPVTRLQVKGATKPLIAKDIPEKYAIDLIAMGKSGTDALSRILLGSTTAYVVRNADTNVTVVSMPDEA